MRKLTIDDIADHRAYERERPELRAAIIALKRTRRVALGDLVSVVFENTDTMRYQIQEMARAERILTDDAIAHEVEVYNELVPGPGELSGTIFVELTSDAALREWLPKLVGLQRAFRFEVGPSRTAVPGLPRDEERLTREDVTASVHYVRFVFDADQRAAFAAGPVTLVVDHPAYHAATTLTDEQRAELARDLAD